MTSRARLVHQYLVDSTTPRTLAQIRADVLPDCTNTGVQSAINGLLKYRKIKHVKRVHGHTTYTNVKGVPVERRNQKHPNAKVREAARRVAKPKPAPLRVVAPAEAPAAPMQGSVLGTLNAASNADRSAQIAADVANFLSRGGRIQQLRNGEVSQPLKHIGCDAEYLAARAKGRATQSQRRQSA